VKKGGTPGRGNSSESASSSRTPSDGARPTFSDTSKSASKSPAIPKLDLNARVTPSKPEIIQSRSDADQALEKPSENGVEGANGDAPAGKKTGVSVGALLVGGALLAAAGAAVALHQSPELKKKAEALLEQVKLEVEKLSKA